MAYIKKVNINKKDKTMKKIIEESGLKLKEFAELYNIPYNTVRQWYNEERKCPEYIKSMIIKLIELRSRGTQLPITSKKLYCIEYKTIYGERIQYYATDSEYNRNQQYKCFFEGQEKNYVYFQKFEIQY